MKRMQMVLLGLLAVGLLAVPNLAFASNCTVDTCLELTMSTNGGTTTYDSGLVASPINLTNMTFGNFTITAEGSGLPTLSLPTLLDLFNLAITSTNGGTLTLILTEVNIPVPLGTTNFIADIGGTQSSGSTLDYGACFDGANRNGTSYKCGTGTTQLASKHFTGSSYSSTTTGTGTNTGLYSLTEIITIVMGAHSTTSFDASLSVPEPATLSVLGFGLLALGTGLRVKLFGA